MGAERSLQFVDCRICDDCRAANVVDRFFFFNDTATTEIYTLSDTLSLHDALPIYAPELPGTSAGDPDAISHLDNVWRSEEHTSELQSPLNISYAVFCLKKKNESLCTLEFALAVEIFGLRRPELGVPWYEFRVCFFFNDPATTEIYTLSDTLSLHDALPIRGQERTSLPRAEPAASLSASRSAAMRSMDVSSCARSRRSASRKSGSSITFCGKTFSARPGTNTVSKLRPRTAATGATNTLPCRLPEGGMDSSVSRRARTKRTSARETGPTGPMGASSASSERTRAGSRRARVASALSGSSHAAQVALAGSDASASSRGSAKSRSDPRSATSRSMRWALASSSAKAERVLRSC